MTSTLQHLKNAVDELRAAEVQPECGYCAADITDARLIVEDLVSIAALADSYPEKGVPHIMVKTAILAEKVGALAILSRVTLFWRRRRWKAHRAR